MYGIDDSTAIASPPTVPAAGTQGYFTEGSPPTTPPTKVPDWWLNMVQAELLAILTVAGETPDKTNNGQVADIVEPVIALDSASADTGVTTTAHTNLVAASTSSEAGNGPAFVAACVGGVAYEAQSAVLASQSSGAAGRVLAEGEQSFVAACFANTAGSEVKATGEGSTVLSSKGGTTGSDVVRVLSGADYSAIIACSAGGSAGAYISSSYSAIIASSACRAVTATDDNVAVIASTGADVGIGTGANAFVAACDTGQAGASESAIIATGGGCLTSGDRSAVVASYDSSTDASETFVAASDGAEADAVNSAILASVSSSDEAKVLKPRSAMIASARSRVAAGTANGYSVLIASERCELASDNTLAMGYDATTTPTFSGSDQNLTFKVDGTLGRGYFDDVADFGSADYAEFFPNKKKGILAPGRFVELVGEKVQLAGDGSEALGVVSAAPSIVGNSASLRWDRKFQVDEWGAPILVETACVRWPKLVEKIKGDDGETVRKVRDGFSGAIDSPECPPRKEWPEDAEETTKLVRALSPDYDPSKEYTSRRDRPKEWTQIALLGQVRVAVTEAAKVGDYLAPTAGGLGAPSSAGRVRVMRIDAKFDEAKGYAVAYCLVR